jgi:uncharacterized membrane protein
VSVNPGFLLIALNSIVVSVSSVCFKLGATQTSITQPLTLIKNRWVILGVAFTPLTLILNVAAYRFGDVSALHPLLQLSLVWNVALAIVIFKEKINQKTLLGTALILSGAVFITLSQ